LTVLGWGVVIAGAVVAIAGAAWAIVTQSEAERTGSWIACAASTAVALTAWWLVPAGPQAPPVADTGYAWSGTTEGEREDDDSFSEPYTGLSDVDRQLIGLSVAPMLHHEYRMNPYETKLYERDHDGYNIAEDED
jgi:hypothetical protein